MASEVTPVRPAVVLGLLCAALGLGLLVPASPAFAAASTAPEPAPVLATQRASVVPASVRPALTRGSHGPWVSSLQRALGVSVTGFFGARTEAAVKAVQRRAGLPVTGRVDARTWTAVESHAGLPATGAGQAASSGQATEPSAGGSPTPSSTHSSSSASGQGQSHDQADSAYPVLRRGSSGPWVKRAQRLLDLPATGHFGRKTRAAVVAFQQEHHLTADGVIRAATWVALAKAPKKVHAAASSGTQAEVSAPLSVSAALLAGSAATRNPGVPTSSRGVYASAYVGHYYSAASESRRRCIVKRESEGFYHVVAGSGHYFGAYQMSAGLAKGAVRQILPSLRNELGSDTANAVVDSLLNTPVNRWSRYWQDRAFWVIWDFGRGRSNWAGGRWYC